MGICLWWRMGWIALRLAWPDWCAPWRSPLLRWRIETYGYRGTQGQLLHAEAMTPSSFCTFLVRHRQALWRFLRWAASL